MLCVTLANREIVDIVTKNLETLHHLYPGSRQDKSNEALGVMITERFRRLFEGEVTAALNDVTDTVSVGGRPTVAQIVATIPTQATVRLCAIHRGRQKVESSVKALAGSFSGLISFLASAVFFVGEKCFV